MDDRSSDKLQDIIEFLVLNTLQSEPMSDVEIAFRIERRTRGLLKGNAILFLPALNRLERAGWIETALRRSERSSPEIVYSLTTAGKGQLAEEWKRRRSALAEFVEDGQLDESFRKFITRDTGCVGL